MKFYKRQFFKENLHLFFLSTVFLSACANIVSPTGGPKDVTAPKLQTENPKNKTLNFSEKKIEIEFDELVQLKNQYKEITVSPEMDPAPDIVAKKNIIQIKLLDTLEKNTTYSINFGNSIADVTESNPLKNYRYVFSTGSYIDSLKISGTVNYVVDTSKLKNVIVALYPTDKETLYKQKPILYTSVTTGGKFELNNIKNGSYNIYAIADDNGNKRFDEEEYLGFLDKPIELQKDSTSLNFTIARQIPRKLRVRENKYYEGRIMVKLNYPDDSVKFNVLFPEDFKNKINIEKATADSLSLWLPSTKFDSIKIELTKQGKAFDTILVRNFNYDPKMAPIKITDNLKSDLLKPGDTFNLIFSRPLKDLDISKVELLEDSVKKTNFRVALKPGAIREYIVTYSWDTTKKYDINIKENQLLDVFGKTNAAYKRKFIPDSTANYGTVSANFTITPGKQYIAQTLTSSNEVARELLITENKVYHFSLVNPDKYRIRYIEDVNKNGKWDIGDIYKGVQPEPVFYYKDEVSVRAGWEIEININLN